MKLAHVPKWDPEVVLVLVHSSSGLEAGWIAIPQPTLPLAMVQWKVKIMLPTREGLHENNRRNSVVAESVTNDTPSKRCPKMPSEKLSLTSRGHHF